MISTIFRVILLFSFIELAFTNSCSDMMNIIPPKFKLLRTEARSENHILTQRNISTFENCLEFSIAKKALAFNFSPIMRRKYSGRDYMNRFNCQALACPEVNSLHSLIGEDSFKYYSSYSRKLNLGNETAVCVPSVGLFVHIQQAQNYTNAQLTCGNIGGKLSNIMSAKRTDGLSSFLFREKPVYVGLSNRGKERYWKNEFGNKKGRHISVFFTQLVVSCSGHKLDCVGYRRWAQGEPSTRGCVALIPCKVHGNIRTFWKVFPCSHTFSFICEILPRHLMMRAKA